MLSQAEQGMKLFKAAEVGRYSSWKFLGVSACRSHRLYPGMFLFLPYSCKITELFKYLYNDIIYI